MYTVFVVAFVLGETYYRYGDDIERVICAHVLTRNYGESPATKLKLELVALWTNKTLLFIKQMGSMEVRLYTSETKYLD